jgi:protein-disulfide isomerase
MMKFWMAMGTAALLGTLSMPLTAIAQTKTPPVSATPLAPAPHAAPTDPFPPQNPKNFTAATPTREEVDGFLKSMWGYEGSRIWSVAAILKTQAPGVAKVVVLVGNKNEPTKIVPSIFFTTPDGKHAIADGVIDFGTKPFAASRELLQASADGPALGAKSNDLLLVEFADLQCDRCAEAQEKIEHLQQDFPKARIVFEDTPLTAHPFSQRAGLLGACVRQAKGDEAFFAYARSIYAKQAGLTKESADAVLDAAVTAAGADPKAVAACAVTPEAGRTLNSSMKLAADLGIDQTPMLEVNGRPLPLAAVPYETLKRIVAFQAEQDGIAVHLQPTLSTLK